MIQIVFHVQIDKQNFETFHNILNYFFKKITNYLACIIWNWIRYYTHVLCCARDYIRNGTRTYVWKCKLVSTQLLFRPRHQSCHGATMQQLFCRWTHAWANQRRCRLMAVAAVNAAAGTCAEAGPCSCRSTDRQLRRKSLFMVGWWPLLCRPTKKLAEDGRQFCFFASKAHRVEVTVLYRRFPWITNCGKLCVISAMTTNRLGTYVWLWGALKSSAGRQPALHTRGQRVHTHKRTP